jgi:hypothetical protein
MNLSDQKVGITKSNVTRALLLIASVIFVARYIHSNWAMLGNREWDMQWHFVLFAVFGTWVTFLLSALFWQRTLATLGAEINYVQAWRTYYPPLLGKYIPGKVWAVLGLAHFAVREGVPTEIAGVAAGLFQIAAIPGFSLAFLVTVPFWSLAPSQSQIILALSAILTIVIVSHPRILFPVLNFIFRIARKPEIEVNANPLQIYWLLVVFSTAVSLFYGVAFAIFVRSLTLPSLSDYPMLAGSFCLAILLGLISIFVPAGVGVREGVLLAILSRQLSPDLAIVITIGSRLWFTVAEVSFVGISWLLLRSKK